MNNPTINVALVDDHTLFRQGLVNLLREYSGIQVVFEASHGLEMIEKIKLQALLPDVVLLDITMPVMDGFQSCNWLFKNYPQIKVLALSMADEEKPIITMLKNGAKGYLLKEVSIGEVNAAIRMVYRDGYYLNEYVSQKMFQNLQSPQPISEKSLLNTNELKFLELCATELTYKEMAGVMHLSHHTIDNYRENLFEKLGVKSRTGLIVFAIKHELIRI